MEYPWRSLLSPRIFYLASSVLRISLAGRVEVDRGCDAEYHGLIDSSGTFMRICTKCQIEKPYEEFHKSKKGKNGYTARCKSCCGEYNRRPENIERRKQIRKNYRKRPEVKEKEQNWRKEYSQRPEVKERRCQLRQRPEVIEKKKQYEQRPEVRERDKKSKRKYREKPENKFRIKVIRHNRRVLIRSLPNEWTPELVEIRLLEQNFKCIYCFANIADNYELDHMVPVFSGGGSTADNLQLLCRPCNTRKKNKTNMNHSIAFANPWVGKGSDMGYC